MSMFTDQQVWEPLVAVNLASRMANGLRTSVAIMRDLSIIPLDSLDPDVVFESAYRHDEILEIVWHPDE